MRRREGYTRGRGGKSKEKVEEIENKTTAATCSDREEKRREMRDEGGHDSVEMIAVMK